MDSMAVNSTMTFTQQGTFYGSVTPQGDIVVNEVYAQRIIGVTTERYKRLEEALNQALSKAETYHKQLVDAGLIVVPKTLEEQIAELLAHCSKQDERIAAQSSQITQLTELITQERDYGLSSNCQNVSASKQPDVAKDRDGAKFSKSVSTK